MSSHNNASPHLSQYDVRQEGEPGAGGEYNVQVRCQRDTDVPLEPVRGVPLGAFLLFVSFSADGRF